MKIVDCVIFYNEIEMLKYRLSVLNQVVDYFIVVESTHTHVGNEKELYFKNNENMFSSFKEKIVHIIVDDFPFKQPNIDVSKNDQWTNEIFQRNCIKRGLDALNLDNSDVIIIADVDEIPDPNTLAQIKQNYAQNNIQIQINKLEMDMYYYNLNSQIMHKWYHTVIVTAQKFKQLSIQCNDLRFFNCEIIRCGGWHLSYFGNSDFIQNKLKNFTHQEFNHNEFTDLTHINKKILSGEDLFNRDWNKLIKIKIAENPYLPPEYDTYLRNFYS